MFSGIKGIRVLGQAEGRKSHLHWVIRKLNTGRQPDKERREKVEAAGNLIAWRGD